MKIESSYFKRREFACQCGCGFDTVDEALLYLLNQVRMHFEQPVTITSGCRCVQHNRDIGGAPMSQHVFGRAADIKVKDTDPEEVYDMLNLIMQGQGGLGLYQRAEGGWVHVDSRTKGGARWKG